MKTADILRKTGKALIFSVIALLLLVCGFVVTLYSPWTQQTLRTAFLGRYGHNPDGTDIALSDFRLTFPLQLHLEGLSITQNGDTLIAAGHLDASVNPLGLLVGRVSLAGARLSCGHYTVGTPDSSMYMTIDADSIALAPGSVALADMHIDLTDAYIGGARVAMALNPDTMPPAPSQPSTMRITLRRLLASDLSCTMRMMPTIDTLSASFERAVLNGGEIDLGHQTVSLGGFTGSGLAARYIVPDSAAIAAFGTIAAAPAAPDSAPAEPWTVTIDSLAFDRSRALYATAGAAPLPGLDFTYIAVDDLSLRLHDFLNRGTTVRLPLEVSGRERCGVRLNASGTLDIDSVALNFRDFNLTTAEGTEASFSGHMGMGDMASDPALPLGLTLESRFAPADLRDMFPAFAPVLAGLPAGSPIVLDADADGTTGHLDISSMRLIVNRCVNMEMAGWVGNFMNPARIGGDIRLRGNIADLSSFKDRMPEGLAADEIRIPQMSLRGRLAMDRGIADGNLTATTGNGAIHLEGIWKSRIEDYRAELRADSFPVAAFLPNSGIGAVRATLSASGHGYNAFSASTSASAELNVASVEYRHTDYTDIQVRATLADGKAEIYLNSDNYAADLTFEATGNLDGSTYSWCGRLDGRNIDLSTLGFSPEPANIEVSAEINATVNPTARDYQATLALHDFYYRRLTGTLAISDVNAHFASADKLTTLKLRNRDLTAEFSSPCGVDTLITRFAASSAMLERQMKDYSIRFDSLGRELPRFEFTLRSGASNMVNDLLSLSGMNVRRLNLDACNDSTLSLSARALRFSTASMSLDSLYLDALQRADSIFIDGGLENQPGNLDTWHKVRLAASADSRELNLRATQQNLQGKTGFDIGANISAQPQDSTLTLRMKPTNPVIGYHDWTVNDNNYLSYTLPSRRIEANLHMRGGNSALALYTEATSDTTTTRRDSQDLVVSLDDIHIQDWIAFNPWAPPMKGDVSADMRLFRADNALQGRGSAGITNFTYGRQRIADFKADFNVQADRSGALRADADLAVDGVRTVTLRGALNDTTSTSPLDLDLSMIRFPLATVNPFLPAGTGKLSGMLNGSLEVSGEASAPIMNGYLELDSTQVAVSILGSTLTFSGDSIPVRNSVVSFDDYAIRGCNANPLVLNGSVDLSRISDMKLDLNMKARDFQLVDSKRASRGAEVYGKAFVDLDARVAGDMTFMTADADLKILSETNLTYVMTTATSALTNQSAEDMVKFVNFTDSLAVERADSITGSGLAMLLDASLAIEDGSVLSVDLSTDGKNKVQLQANGELEYTMTPMSTGRLTGRINIDKGFARYGMPPVLSEQLFNFQNGSNVSFNGDMMNPTLNIHAVNTVKANVTQSGANSRLVNFDIALSVTGTLERMNVAFDMSTNDDITVANELESMSPEQRANQAMNLMLYHVYTGGTSKGNSSLSNPLYGFLAGQLNNWAANNIKGIDVSFGIDQYDRTIDGSTSQTTSYSYQVSKSLFNDRFKIVVGGNYSTDANSDENFSQNLINDISFEYYLNKTRSMYIRLFRHTGYESILEGEITQTGVGFVYRRKISRLGDMFLTPGQVRRRNERENSRLEQPSAAVSEANNEKE